MSYIICHYGEIGLKGKNRKFFEETLVRNIKTALSPIFFNEVHPVKCPEGQFAKGELFNRVKRISGRIIIKLSEKGIEQQKAIKEKLRNVFGIVYFALAENCEQKIEAIKEKALGLLKNKKFKTFRISTQRSKKDFFLNSQEINEKVGEFILQKYRPKPKVNLKKPGITCFIEIVDKYAFLYLKKIKAQGGLPVGVSGKALSLLSGGIDSPVASFLGMKRGLKLVFLHFHSLPYTDRKSIDKVQKIIKVLNKFQYKAKLYLVSLAEIQKQVLLKTPAKLRVLLYRRMMFRIAQKIAEKEKITAIITGESLGQVASQTLENLKAIEEVLKNVLVLRPLIGEDKEEIIKKAKQIGTYEISILPHQDCCSRFVPEHPETRAKLEEIKKAEKAIDIKKLVNDSQK
ncbi:tRNA 4-thiouridine(8) synthase ThiI [Patescibacteria group bacterium]|nr:tRNA 4-thiouridine(8) synthase ThiI [Patescibacteria group bacterium]